MNFIPVIRQEDTLADEIPHLHCEMNHWFFDIGDSGDDLDSAEDGHQAVKVENREEVEYFLW